MRKGYKQVCVLYEALPEDSVAGHTPSPFAGSHKQVEIAGFLLSLAGSYVYVRVS